MKNKQLRKLKGGKRYMKMRNAGIALIALLMISSIFAGSIVLANGVIPLSDADESVSTSEIVSDDLEANEIQKVLDEIVADDDLRRVGFTRAIHGVGSMNTRTSGHLINVIWLRQDFVDANIDDTSELARESDETRAYGILKVVGGDNLKLVRYSGDEDSARFYIVSPQVRADIANAERSNLGTLTLEKTESYEGLDKWEGSLVYNNDGPESTWEVEIATRTRVVRPDPGLGTSDGSTAATEPFPQGAARQRAAAAEGIGVEAESDRGFFGRLRAFFSSDR